MDSHLARQIADQTSCGKPATLAIESENVGATTRWAQKIEQQADRRRFSRAVRAQKAEHLSSLDFEVESFDPDDGAEVLGEILGLDRGAHRSFDRDAF